MFEKTSNIIKDPSVFDYDYIPRNLVNRDGQMHQLESLFRPLVESNRPCNAFLLGSVGTGKTVTAKRFCNDMKDYCSGKGMKMDVLYVNCRSNNSESAVLIDLIHHFDPGYPDRGFSTEEMARILKNHLNKNRSPLVIILDEVNVLLKKNSVDIIYQITRMSDDVAKPAPVSLIMISQESVYEMMDEASASTFRRSITIKFNKYSYDELKTIVKERSEIALFPGRISDDAIEQIADSSEEYGDARMAIELLERSASLAEESTVGEVTVEDVRAAKALIYSTVSESKISSLDINKKIALLSVARAMKQNVVIPISSAEKTYAIVCEEFDVPARRHTQFWKYIQDLEKIGLVRTRVMTEGKNGRSTKISLPDIPSKVLAKKVEEMVENDLRTMGASDEM
ncbi:MAG: AAA family ATPase [Thermoplasmata archaeon]|jgi:cell division control protein 6|nr:AAA family ATPase [Thermoplasmata archaeon]